MSIEVGLGFGTALGCDEGTAGDVKVDVRDDVLVIGDGDVTAVPDGVAVAGVTGDDAV